MPQRVLEMLPFFLMVDVNGAKKLKPNISRIVEALVISAIGGVISGYIAVAKIEVKLDSLQKQVQVMDQRFYDHVTSK